MSHYTFQNNIFNTYRYSLKSEILSNQIRCSDTVLFLLISNDLSNNGETMSYKLFSTLYQNKKINRRRPICLCKYHTGFSYFIA